MRVVLDASMALTFVIDDEFDDSASFMLSTLKHVSALVPYIWHSEVVNGLLSAKRRKRIDDAGISRGIELLERLAVEVEDDPPSMELIRSMAEKHKLTAYDATYVLLAQREGIGLCTNDDAMARAAKAVGVPLR